MTGCLIKLQFCSIQTPPLLQMYIGNTSYLPKDQFFRSFPMIVMVQQFFPLVLFSLLYYSSYFCERRL